jgi:Tfp pilus assembly protein PilX
MKHNHALLYGEQGFILVLAMFMLAICSIIGVAAMLTSTTEIDIAGNERVHKQTLYQAEAGYVVGAEAIRNKEGYATWEDNEIMASLGENETITIKDGNVLLEGREDYPAGSGVWSKDKQHDSVEKAADIEIRVKDRFNIDVDVDKISVKYIAGGGVEFASGSEGMGVSMHKIIYNMDCLGTLPAWDAKQNTFSRKLHLDGGGTDPATPFSEVIVGYGFIPR